MTTQANMTTKILIVEDEKSLRQALAAKLQAAGYTVVEAENGTAGLESVRRDKPQLALIDLRIPEIDGEHVIREIKTMQAAEQPKIIVITNIDDEKAVNLSLQDGVKDYLVKANLSMDEILDVVARRLAEKS